jgi:hypothetical protein
LWKRNIQQRRVFGNGERVKSGNGTNGLARNGGQVKGMESDRRKCIFCEALLPRTTDGELTIKCPACHMTMGICSCCGNIQDPKILHPFGMDKKTAKTIQVCCSRCFEEAQKKSEIDWVVSVRYKDVWQGQEVLSQSNVELTLDPKWEELRQASAKGFNDVDPESPESVFCYDDLPEHFTKRAKELFPVVKKMFPSFSFKDWINDFKYDLYPERELGKWEDKVKQYSDKTGGRKVYPKKIKVVWATILVRMSRKKYIEYSLRKWL